MGITAISPTVSYRPCVTHSFVPLLLPQPPDAFSHRIYSIFRSLTAPLRYSGPGFITPTQAPLRCLYRLSYVHHDPHGPATCIPSCIDSQRKNFATVPSNINSLPVAAGRPFASIVSSVAPTYSFIRSFSSAKARSVLRAFR